MSCDFFYMRPNVPLPMIDRMLRPFFRLLLRQLRRVTKLSQKPTKIIGVVLDLKCFEDDFANAFAGPLLVRKTVSNGTGLENGFELFDLLFVKFRCSTGAALTFETVETFRFDDGFPAINDCSTGSPRRLLCRGSHRSGRADITASGSSKHGRFFATQFHPNFFGLKMLWTILGGGNG